MPLPAGLKSIGVLMLAFYASTAFAQDAPVRMLYGSPITLESAKKAAAAALAAAHKRNGTPSVAIVDIAGDLVYFEKMDGADTGSVDNAIDKARSAARYKRSTKWFEDTLAAGGNGLRVLRTAGAMPMEGGIPIVQGGRIVGAIGVGGGPGPQLGQWAEAGAAAVK